MKHPVGSIEWLAAEEAAQAARPPRAWNPPPHVPQADPEPAPAPVAVVKEVPTSVVEWFKGIVRRHPVASDDFEVLPGIKLGDLRRWLG